MKKLVEEVQKQFQKLKNSRQWNAWIYGTEGSVYIRWNKFFDRIDLATFSIHEKFQNKGIAFAIINLALKQGMKTVQIENILNKEWAEKVKLYRFDGFDTKITTDGVIESVRFIKRSPEKK